jgi:hypothetical protein
MSEEKELEAMVDLCTDFSFGRCVGLASALVTYQREHPSYTVIAVLPPELARRIEDTFKEKGDDFDFSDFGHLCIPFSYLGKQGVVFHYTDVERFPPVLATVKKEMATSGVENLYQICVASASDNVVEALQKQQYNVTVIQR